MTRTWFSPEQIARAKRLDACGYTLGEIAERIGSTKSTVGKLKRRGWKRHSRADRPRPMDLSLRAGEMKIRELMAHYRVGNVLLRRWLAEAQAERPNMRRHAPIRPMPDDFIQVAQRLGHKALQRHYHATGYVVTRWKVEAGLSAPKHEIYVRRIRAAERSVGWAERYVERLAA